MVKNKIRSVLEFAEEGLKGVFYGVCGLPTTIMYSYLKYKELKNKKKDKGSIINTLISLSVCGAVYFSTTHYVKKEIEEYYKNIIHVKKEYTYKIHNTNRKVVLECNKNREAEESIYNILNKVFPPLSLALKNIEEELPKYKCNIKFEVEKEKRRFETEKRYVIYANTQSQLNTYFSTILREELLLEESEDYSNPQ